MPRSEQAGPTILLVDDDRTVAETLRDGLTAEGYVVCVAPTGMAAEELVESVKPDLIVTELMLPDQHGLLLCANLQPRLSVPIIVYSRTRRRDDAALALELGAADFVPKPVSLEELQLRIERALQGSGSATTSRRQRLTTLGPLTIDATRRLVTVSGQELATTPTEYRLLSVLLERADGVVSMSELAEAVWGHDDSSLAESLRVHLRRLRAKLRAMPERTPELIAVRSFGYRLVWDPVRPAAAR